MHTYIFIFLTEIRYYIHKTRTENENDNKKESLKIKNTIAKMKRQDQMITLRQSSKNQRKKSNGKLGERREQH